MVIEKTIAAPSAPPVSIHHGWASVSPISPKPRRATTRSGRTITPVTIAATITASSEPIRSPSFPITAICTAPRRPARTARVAASPVESIAGDAIRSRP